MTDGARDAPQDELAAIRERWREPIWPRIPRHVAKDDVLWLLQRIATLEAQQQKTLVERNVLNGALEASERRVQELRAAIRMLIDQRDVEHTICEVARDQWTEYGFENSCSLCVVNVVLDGGDGAPWTTAYRGASRGAGGPNGDEE